MTDLARLEFRRTDSRSAGSCNFCNRHAATASGVTPAHDVTELRRSDGGGVCVRLCDGCLRDLGVRAETPATPGKGMASQAFLHAVLTMTHNALGAALPFAVTAFGFRHPRVAVLRHVAQVVVALSNGQSGDARDQLDKALQAAERAEAQGG